MALYAIGDLHLSLSSNKPMEIFGDGWRDYVARIREGFSVLTEDDVTVLCGDLSWGMIYAYLEDYTGDRVCSKQLYEEALGNLNSPADWETRAICEIMNTGIAGGIIQGWVAYKSPKRYKKYGSQKGWERVNQAPPEGDGFQEITEEEARQMELPF